MKYLVLLTFGCFCVLTSFAYGRAAQWQPHPRQAAEPVVLREAFGYSDAERAANNGLVLRAIRDAAPDTGYGACGLRQKFGLKPCMRRL